ncbi:DUF397 domain-containing protein [Micromonospora endophytica]|uniref:DUF397 domain-containing protein n=1 Tax=Micromonospora endophytica TaxID=515350 RepID=A0A2W2BY37_9ACTN|nr:DUF397 domain-containing protein [Micromonospora endophytica]PZF84768.1 DUF397 domain-containing protein [Micromonospora endophytica]RIW50776.1 DUF397 domain-containing protein [Micromonospora endophytica]BCJ58470.1 hypothetical protein Jiend_18920 [Micromonospora endophytica]
MELTDACWRTATRSSNNGGNCVEVADNLPGRVLVRDSKAPNAGTLTFTPSAWRAFVADTPRRTA